MAILITGGAGFIGTNLAKRLLKKDVPVITVDNLITGSYANVEYMSKYKRYSFIHHDITNPFPKKLTRIKFDTIYHLACPTGVPNLGPLSYEMALTCSVGTRNVLEFARNSIATVIFTSSSEVYGNPLVFPQSEEYTGNVSPIGFRSPYEEGKRFAESLVSLYVRKYNLDCRIVRIFNTYGPFMSQTDTRVIPRFIRQVLNGEPLSVHGKGLQTRTFCYVDDIVEGFFAILKKGSKGEVYNLGSNIETTVKDIAHLILKLTGSKSSIVFADRPQHDHNRRLPDLRKIKKLGWKTKVNLSLGIQKLLLWYGF